MQTKPTYQELEKELQNLKRTSNSEALLDFTGVMFIEMDLNGIVVKVNKKACEILGYEEKEIIGKNWFENFLPERIKKEILAMTEKFHSGELEIAEQYENPIITKKGEERVINWHNKPIVNENGNITGNLSIGEDISERKKIEDLLKEKEHFLNESQKIARLGSYKLDINSGNWQSSTLLDDIFGIDQNYTRNVSGWVQIIDPRDQAMMQEYFSVNILTNHEKFNKEYRILKVNNNQVCWVHGLGELEFSDDEKPIKLIGTIQDITERKIVELKLLKSENKFKKLFDKNPVSLWEEDYSEVKQLLINKRSETQNLKKYLDKNPEFVHECISKLEILNVNDSSLKLIGFTNKKELITNFDKIFNENSIEVFKEQLVAIAQNKKEFSSETELIRRNGKIINVLIKFENISDDNKAIVSIVDITELNKAKEKIVESEVRFRELYEKSGDAILIIVNGVFVECNQATVDMLEYESKEDFLNSHPSKLSPIFQQDGQKSFDKAVDMMNTSLKKGTHRFEWIHTKKNGVDFPVEVLLTAIANESDNQIIHCVWRDITERKKAELKLKESENELRQSQEIAQLGTFNFNISTQVFVSSPIFDSIVGFKVGDKKTLETYKEIIHPDDFVMNGKMLKECIKTSKKFNREYRIFNYSTKELMWLHGFGEIIFGESDEMYFKGTIQDITERKLIELEVKLNERKLKEIQKIANLGTYEIDLKTNDIITSELYNSIFGIKKKPTNNKEWWKSITHPDDFEQRGLLWQQCINDCETYNDEYRILTENNEIRWIQDIAEVKGNNGLATKVVGTVQDVTERKNFEEQIKRSDDILNKINSLVVVNNAKGDIIYISPSVKSILGYEPSVMLGRGWWRLTYADDELGKNRIKELFKHFSGENSKTHAVSVRRIKTNDGNYKLIEWHISKASDDTFISIGIDVTEKKEQEEQFKTLTETAHDAIILVDHNGLIFEWNKSSEETFGYSKQEIEGKSITSLMPEKYRLQYKKGFGEVMQTGLKESYRNNIVEGLTKEGLVFPMELSLNFWESNNNYVYCYFIRDITQRERDEKIKELIFNITNKSNEALDLKKFFHYIKTELGKLINTENFFIALYDEKTEMISTPYMVDELDTADDFPKGETLTGHVIDTKSALLTKEIILDPKSKAQKPIGLGPESKCWLGVPMLIEDKAIGAIVVQSYTDENAYTQDDVAFLELVASNIGQAVKKTEDLMQINLLNKALIQSPQAVIITNIKGDIEYINPAFTGLSGYTEADVIGKNPRILKSSKHLPEYYKNLWQTISNGKTWEGEFVNMHKDGSSYLVEANISSVKNENGIITHYISVQEDITEKRKLERQFINTFIDAQELEKQNFGEELHDSISQILSAEGMYINLLIEQNQDRINDKAKFLTKIKELNTNAVNETRNIAHGLMSSQLKQSGLLIAVENICIDFNNSKNIMFSFLNIDVKEEDLSKEIKTNLFRVIQELTTNITRYSSATNASVEFSKVSIDKLRLIVEDNGIGMDYGKIKKERKITGLKNVERRIIFLNGTLDVESRPYKGTRWKIIVPLKNIQ